MERADKGFAKMKNEEPPSVSLFSLRQAGEEENKGEKQKTKTKSTMMQ